MSLSRPPTRATPVGTVWVSWTTPSGTMARTLGSARSAAALGSIQLRGIAAHAAGVRLVGLDMGVEPSPGHGGRGVAPAAEHDDVAAGRIGDHGCRRRADRLDDRGRRAEAGIGRGIDVRRRGRLGRRRRGGRLAGPPASGRARAAVSSPVPRPAARGARRRSPARRPGGRRARPGTRGRSGGASTKGGSRPSSRAYGPLVPIALGSVSGVGLAPSGWVQPIRPARGSPFRRRSPGPGCSNASCRGRSRRPSSRSRSRSAGP